jgi:hypothetical protein
MGRPLSMCEEDFWHEHPLDDKNKEEIIALWVARTLRQITIEGTG